MILKESLSEIIAAQKKDITAQNKGIKRELLGKIDLRSQFALVISGIRRCGKSTLLRQLIEKLPNFYYLNFEDTRLSAFETSDFEKIDEIFEGGVGSNFYFFDEIQNIKGWEVFVRSKLDKDRVFVITGSNASLLSKELGTRLTGRHINIELFPFSYVEMLLFKKKKASIKTFDEYLAKGGFPEYLLYGKADILRELFVDVIQRDITVRHGIRNSKTLREMALYLLTNVGKEFSYNALKETFNLGSINTAISFVSYFEDSYLLFTVPKFDYSLKKRIVNQKKIYSIDNGLSNANSVSFSDDKGRMLENAVFMHLRREYKEIFYFRERKECDFLLREGNKIIAAIQVTYHLNADNKDRELNGLSEAMEKFGLNEGLILTYDQEDHFDVKGKKVTIKPVWKWLTEDVTLRSGAQK